MSSYKIIQSIEKKQYQLKKAIATDNANEILSDEDKRTLENLERMGNLYRYQNATAKGLIQLGRFMLKAYDTYIALLKDLNHGVQSYFEITSQTNTNFQKMMNDILFWFNDFKKTLIRFQAFTRGTTFMEFRLLFKSYYVVKNDTNEGQGVTATGVVDNYESLVQSTNNSFETWMDCFTSQNILGGRTRSNPVNNQTSSSPNTSTSLSSGPSGLSDATQGVPAYQTDPKNAFLNVDVFSIQNIGHLDDLSSDALQIRNIDNTPYVILQSLGDINVKNNLIYLDPQCLDQYVTDELQYIQDTTNTPKTQLDEIMTNVAQISYFLLDTAVNNKSAVEYDFHYVEVTQESSCANLEFIDSEIESITSIDRDELVSMIENGNALKEQLRKLPIIGNKSVFSYQEKKKLGFDKCGH